MRVEDLSRVEGEEHWKLIDVKTITPVLKSLEGMESPELLIPITTVSSNIT
jgi:hypothetical protein